MGNLLQTLLRSTDLSMAYIPCCSVVLMHYNGLAMSSSGLIRKYYRMSRNLINNNNITDSTDTAITYSLCYAPFFNHKL